MAHVRTITQKCVSVDPHVSLVFWENIATVANYCFLQLQIRKQVSQLLTSLLTRLTALEKYEDFLYRINTEAALAEPLTAVSGKSY